MTIHSGEADDDRLSDAPAIDVVLAGDLTTVIARAGDLEFVEKVEAARREQRRAAWAANKKGRGVPATTVVRIPVAPWGWADFSVRINSDAAPLLLAAGVVAPGHGNISELAMSHDVIPIRAQTAVAGTAGVIAGAGAGGLAHWPGWLDALVAVGLGAVGATGQIAWYRARIRNRRLSFRRRADDPTAPMLTAALAVLTTLAATFARYDRDMRQRAEHEGVQPVALEPRTRQVPAAIHQALWELGTQATSDTEAGVLAATRSAATAAVADVHGAWRAFASFLPAPLDEDDPAPPPPVATPARNLQELAETIDQDRKARQLGVDDVHRINRRLQD